MTTVLDLRPQAAQLEKASPRAETAAAATAQRVPQALEAEQYRVLGHIVEQLVRTNRPVIAITSPVAGDGKTTTSLKLARTLAQAPDARILVVDADLRRGTIGEQLGIGRSTSAGLSGAIADPRCRLDAVVRRRPASNLSVLPAGVCPPMPYEALRSPRFGELLVEARQRYACVLVDTPPVVPVADVRGLSQWVDAFFLVVAAHSTPRELVEEALSAMDPEKVVGIVFNGDDMPLSRRYRHYYSYGDAAPPPGFWASLFGMAGAKRRGGRECP